MKFLPPTIPYLILAILLTFYSPEKVVAMTSPWLRTKEKKDSAVTTRDNSNQARHKNLDTTGEELLINPSMEQILVESQNEVEREKAHKAVMLEFQQHIEVSLQEMHDQLAAAKQVFIKEGKLGGLLSKTPYSLAHELTKKQIYSLE
jgi:hypothetical protein